jgi:hypothetical protein
MTIPYTNRKGKITASTTDTRATNSAGTFNIPFVSASATTTGQTLRTATTYLLEYIASTGLLTANQLKATNGINLPGNSTNYITIKTGQFSFSLGPGITNKTGNSYGFTFAATPIITATMFFDWGSEVIVAIKNPSTTTFTFEFNNITANTRTYQVSFCAIGRAI